MDDEIKSAGLHVLPMPDPSGKARADLERLLRHYRENIIPIIELNIYMAQVTKAKFDALIAAGISRDDAIALCK